MLTTLSWVLPLVLFVALLVLLAVRLRQGVSFSSTSSRRSSGLGRLVLAGAVLSVVLTILAQFGIGAISGIDREVVRLVATVLLFLAVAYGVWTLPPASGAAPVQLEVGDRRRLGDEAGRSDIGGLRNEVQARRDGRKR